MKPTERGVFLAVYELSHSLRTDAYPLGQLCTRHISPIILSAVVAEIHSLVVSLVRKHLDGLIIQLTNSQEKTPESHDGGAQILSI